MIYVLYHDECNDGFAAAYAFWLKFPEYKYIPVKYGDPVPTMLDVEHVYIVDFSYKRKVLLKMSGKFPVTVLDHHKTAQADLQGLNFAHFDMNKSGAMLAWEFVHGKAMPPILFEYIQDRDLWRNSLPFSEKISAYLFQFERTFEDFKLIHKSLDLNFSSCKLEGAAILRYIKQLTNNIASRARKGILCGQEVLFVNTPILQSEVGNKLITEERAAIVAIFYEKEEGIYISLRSRKDVDCSKIAESFGGGGHKNASGFRLPNSPSFDFLGGFKKT
jgi:oligoribonuclease NrnB/cAMP/cGMP phosphodiesterase (DHH superfamily)